MTKVVIAGPNLRDQSKGAFQVHKPGCSHLNRIGGHQDWIFDADDRRSVIEAIYVDFIGPDSECPDNTWQDYVDEVFFSPCCGLGEISR